MSDPAMSWGLKMARTSNLSKYRREIITVLVMMMIYWVDSFCDVVYHRLILFAFLENSG